MVRVSNRGKTGGTGSVEHNDYAPLAGRHVIDWPDVDAPGLDASDKLVAQLAAIAASVPPASRAEQCALHDRVVLRQDPSVA
jgi:hypothetical protein